MVTIIVILTIIILLLSYIIYNLNSKVNMCESMIETSETKHVNTLNKIISWMTISLDKIHNLDRLQIFEADDDVGWFFKTLKFQIAELNNQIAQIIEDENEEKTEEEK